MILTVLLLNAPTAWAQTTFTNPIGNGADPWVVFWQGQYYLTQSGGNIQVSRAPRLQDVARAAYVRVWTPPATGMWSREIWAPEIHYLSGKWYGYVAADDGVNDNHRMYVMEGTTQDPQGPMVFKTKINALTDRWAIDGSVLTIAGNNYFIWSGWEGTVNIRQNIYIAAMSNPWTISGERVLLSTPEFAWEMQGGSPSINEGPQTLYHGNDAFIIYSASGSWSDYYCLGQLRLVGSNPLDSTAWRKSTVPVFSPTAQVFGPGHCSFAKSPDGTEDWILYHAAIASGAGWNRNLRMQRFTWNADGSPNFGTPIPEGVIQQAPSEGATGVLFRSSAARALVLPKILRTGWRSKGGKDLRGRGVRGEVPSPFQSVDPE